MLAGAIDHHELEDEVAVTRDLLYAKLLDLVGSILSEHLVSPQIPHLHELVNLHLNADISRAELEIMVSMFTPVHNKGDGVATRDLGSVDLRTAPESVPAVASNEAGGLGRLRVLIHCDQLLVHKNVQGRLRSDR